MEKKKVIYGRKIAIGILLGLPFVMFFIACANPQSANTLTSQEIIEKCKTVLNDVRSFRNESNTESSYNGTVQRSETFSEYTAPDISHMVNTDESGTTEQVAIGETRYEKLPGSTIWTARKFNQPFTTSQTISLDWAGTFDEISFTQLSDEAVDGAECYHFKGIRDSKAAADKAYANIEKLDPSSPGYEDLKESQERIAESLAGMVSESEFWIDKFDFFLRKASFHQESKVNDPETKIDISLNMSGTFHYYDFNADFTIEVPSPIEGANPVANTQSSSGIDEGSGHYQVKYKITVTNIGVDPANDVRIFLDTEVTDNGRQTFEAEPEINQDSIFPGETINYNVAWNIDLLAMGKDRYLELTRKDVIRCKWTGADGLEKEKVLMENGIPFTP
jgi:hypothetical protein